MTLLQGNCKRTKIELQRRVSGAGASRSVIWGPQGPHSGGGPNSRRQCPMNQFLSTNVIHTTIFVVDEISGCPWNARFSVPLRTIGRIELSKTHPILKACQRVMLVIDSNISARSSEREQRILAASRSAKRALLHRERREI